MFKKALEILGLTVFLVVVFSAGYIIGKPPVTKQDIIESTNSLQSTMLDAMDRVEAEEK